jgi:hypothetical protein
MANLPNVAVAIILVAFGGSAHAQLITNTQFTGSVSFTGPDLTSPGGSQPCAGTGIPTGCTVTEADVNAGGGSGIGRLTAQLSKTQNLSSVDTYLNATMNTSPGGPNVGQAGTADATLKYFVTAQPIGGTSVSSIGPPVPGMMISRPLQFSGLLSFSPFYTDNHGNTQSGYASITVTDLQTSTQLFSDHVYGPFDQSLMNIRVNYPYTVTMHATAISTSTTETTSAFATIDPIFSLSPEDAANFQLVYSPGLLPDISPGSVPEPSTWAMMILGFAGVGFMAYRRRSGAARAG